MRVHALTCYLVWLAMICASSSRAAERPPNIVVIFADDLGYSDLGCYGGEFPTPVLDKMAEEGFRSTDCIVPANICSPSRAALLTGRYPMRNGHPFYRHARGTYGLHPDEITIPELLRTAGYRSLAVGKWHLGFHKKGSHPLDAGFDEYVGYPHNYLDTVGKADRTIYRDRKKEQENVAIEVVTPFYNNEVVRFIEREKDGPFFIYMAHQIAHTPIRPNEAFKGSTKKGPVADFIAELDDSVGQVLRALREADLDRNTLVVFLGDNGPAGQRPVVQLSGMKFNTMEGGHRVPCIFRWTGKIPAGHVSNTTISSMDFLPLFCELAGVDVPTDRTIDGRNIRDVLLGKTSESPHEFLYYYNGHNLQAVRMGKWKLHLPRTKKDQPYWGNGGKGSYFFFELDEPFLVDLEADILEKENVASQHPEVLAALSQEAERIRDELGDVRRVGTDQRLGWPPAKQPSPPRARPAEQTAGPTLRQAQGLPNIVLIFADDLGYGDLGCYGATKVQTPNIDRLAAEGRRFTDGHSASAVCTPSRYALLTGEYPFRANGGRGTWGPLPWEHGLLIPTETFTIGKLLQAKGYATSYFGKWHLGWGDEVKNDWRMPLKSGPNQLGFDYYWGIPRVNCNPPYVYVENDMIVGYDPNDPLELLKKGETPTPIRMFPPEASHKSGNRFKGAVKAHELYDDEMIGIRLTEEAVDWISSNNPSTTSASSGQAGSGQGKKPFFLLFSTTQVHHPFTPAPRFKGASQCGLYGDFVHELDWMVGELVKCLEENGLGDNTLVILTSDNGGMFNRGGYDAFKDGHQINGELLGYKFGAWEGGHRVPFIAKWPGKIPAGTVSDQLICSIDMMATFAAVTGQSIDPVDSVNMVPALVEDPREPVREELVLAAVQSSHLSLRKGKWMYIPAQGSGGFGGTQPGSHGFAGPAAAAYTGKRNSDVVDGKIREDAPPAQLYDLETDVNQTRNLYHAYPEVVREMSERLQELRASAQAKAALKIDAFPSERSASFDFESGELAPWKIVEGSFGHPVGSRETFLHQKDEFNKQGGYYLTTLETGATVKSGSDAQTGVIVSPLFVPQAGTMTFRVGGGAGASAYVALCTEDGTEVMKARGVNSQVMQKAKWDLSSYAGKKLFIKVVDQATGGWGHITADHFEFDGEVLGQYPE